MSDEVVALEVRPLDRSLRAHRLWSAAAIAYLRDQFENAGGTAARFREQMLNTFEGQKQLLAGSLETLAIVAGEPFAQVFKPLVTIVVEVVNAVLNVFRQLPAPVGSADPLVCFPPGAASMNKGSVNRIIKVLLVGLLPALWTVGWAFGSCAMFEGAEDSAREDVALTALPTRVEPGHDVLLEVTAPRGPVVRSLQTQTDCVSAMTKVALSSAYTDSGGTTQWKSVTVAERWVGPDVLTFATNDGLRIDVPPAAGHDRYRNLPYLSVVSEIPARFGISDEELASAHERLQGPERLSGEARLEVSEWVLLPGARMVLVARLAPHEDRFVASPSETLGRIVLAPANSAAEFLAARRSESSSAQIGGWVFAGIAALPALVALVVLAVRRRRNKSEAPGERKSEAVEERFRADLEVEGETFVCGPTPGMYRGSTVEGMSRFVKGDATLVLTEQRLVWRPLNGEAGEIALSDITNVRDEHWLVDRFDGAKDNQPHVVLTLRQGGEVGFFIFRDRAEWVEALRQRARAGR